MLLLLSISTSDEHPRMKLLSLLSLSVGIAGDEEGVRSEYEVGRCRPDDDAMLGLKSSSKNTEGVTALLIYQAFTQLSTT